MNENEEDEMFEEFCPKTEIISNLEKIYKNFSTFSMNDSTIKYFGQKEMLGEIIKYLKRCL